MKTQRSFVARHLKEHGSIGRNFCLDNRISRLAAIMAQLRNEGWDIKGKKEGNDYVYRMKVEPKYTFRVVERNGERLAIKVPV